MKFIISTVFTLILLTGCSQKYENIKPEELNKYYNNTVNILDFTGGKFGFISKTRIQKNQFDYVDVTNSVTRGILLEKRNKAFVIENLEFENLRVCIYSNNNINGYYQGIAKYYLKDYLTGFVEDLYYYESINFSNSLNNEVQDFCKKLLIDYVDTIKKEGL